MAVELKSFASPSPMNDLENAVGQYIVYHDVNIGNPGEFTMLELADLVNELTDNSVGIVHRPLP
ncbi:MAG: hypothetical protein F6K34_29985, partial [Okeania sp. SIO4D6]|nr:hypothetical protein [Okeania sp. SIO4D6]